MVDANNRGPQICPLDGSLLRMRGETLSCACGYTTIVGKRCSRCRKMMPYTEFYKNSARPDGLATACKECSRSYQRQRAQSPRVKAVKRQWRQSEAGREMVRRRVRDPEYKAKKAAHRNVERALANGTLTKPEHCEQCPNTDIQAHHDDYSKPLAVRWLCRGCHAEHHRSP